MWRGYPWYTVWCQYLRSLGICWIIVCDFSLVRVAFLAGLTWIFWMHLFGRSCAQVFWWRHFCFIIVVYGLLGGFVIIWDTLVSTFRDGVVYPWRTVCTYRILLPMIWWGHVTLCAIMFVDQVFLLNTTTLFLLRTWCLVFRWLDHSSSHCLYASTLIWIWTLIVTIDLNKTSLTCPWCFEVNPWRYTSPEYVKGGIVGSSSLSIVLAWKSSHLVGGVTRGYLFFPLEICPFYMGG